MPLTLTRDSVAMGDDVLAPHRYELPLVRRRTVARVARWLARGTYLVSVRGGSTWVLRDHGLALAVISLPERGRGRVVFVADPKHVIEAESVHVDYGLAVNPDVLAAELRAEPRRRTRM